MARSNPRKPVLFPMKYIVTTCGISRATLLRFEDEGLIHPSYKNPGSGYRYYSIGDMADILNVLKFQHLGLTKKEIRDYLNDPETLREGLAALRRKHLVLVRALEDLTADLGRVSTSPSRSVRLMPSLGGTFYTRTEEIKYTPGELQKFALRSTEAFIRAKIPGNTQQTMKVFITDADYETCIGQFDGKKHEVRAVFPTLEHMAGPDIIELPSCNMLTLAVKCNYNQSECFFREIWDTAKKLELQHDGPVCIAGLPDVFAQGKSTMRSGALRLMLRTTQKPDDLFF